MKKGYLSQYFKAVAQKELSAVEVDKATSNQHEFNGAVALKRIFGATRKVYPAHFIYLNDTDEWPNVEEGFLTWYDARENDPKRSEYRLYYSTTEAFSQASTGDTLFLALRPDDHVLVIFTEKDSTIENQIRWLFGLEEPAESDYSVRADFDKEHNRLDFTSKYILEQIGITIEEDGEQYLELILEKFNGTFPKTRVFSEFSRSTVNMNLGESPDELIVSWMEREEMLFRTLEKYLIRERLKTGFEDDVDAFISFSLSVQNRRKSRAGSALENHVECLLQNRGIQYDRTKKTENNSKPDFIFPSIDAYHNPDFSTDLLTMLGAKTTCKDRWRQVLPEAERIAHKHLITMEAAISENQTDEMIYNNVQLVVPRPLHQTFNTKQQAWLMDVNQFFEFVEERQR
ncbi:MULTISPECIES: type II restriction endonuclease [Acetobacterium]|uniref:Type-2 restriction enzyme EcoRII n=1 Tax=Acetobacterium wieringae TaxID=52694 RepID=A0A1F2PFI3_9FIRM|nr:MULTISPECIES: type II restriction endonuclease [Acetobacterium]OFV69602.1 type-2 restriction enzyme EcoRII [Acetobacterium wieringae]OXS26530.1 MAG: restriction endonuclease [Acetobacterium sp. MES1]